MKKQIESVQESIKRLEKLIQLANKDVNYNQDALKKMRLDLIEYTTELSRLRRLEWEETHERLDYGDDR